MYEKLKKKTHSRIEGDPRNRSPMESRITTFRREEMELPTTREHSLRNLNLDLFRTSGEKPPGLPPLQTIPINNSTTSTRNVSHVPTHYSTTSSNTTLLALADGTMTLSTLHAGIILSRHFNEDAHPCHTAVSHVVKPLKTVREVYALASHAAPHTPTVAHLSQHPVQP